MTQIDITTTISTDGGLFFQRDLEFPSRTIRTPLKTHPINCLTVDHGIRESTRDVAEVHRKIDATDLEAYRSNSTSQSLNELHKDLRYSINDELVVVFLEYTEAEGIEPEDMRAILDIQDEVADILTMPLIPKITDALSPYIDSGVRFDRTPWHPYYFSVRQFLENVVDYNKPAMGVLPPIGWSRRQEILREYEADGLQLYAIDFGGLKATSERGFKDLKNIIADINLRFAADDNERVLFATNYWRYHAKKNANFYPSEAIALIAQGIDIAGETHNYRMGGSGNSEITDTKIYNPTEFGFDAVPLDELTERWNYQCSIPADQFAGVSDGKRRELRKLANAELMSNGLKKLRAAIQDGNERSFLEQKTGYQGDVATLANRMVRNYENAVGPNVI